MRLANHPQPLRVLLITEAGERFGGYLLIALLTIYLTEHLGWSAASALRTNGLFVALCYGLSLPAGLLADRRRAHAAAVGIGCGLMTAGYLFFTVGNSSASVAGLVLVAVGSGLFKPCLPALLGSLYVPSDPRRAEGFTAFYASANLGALFAPPAGEWLRHHYGWSVAFAVAAVVQFGTTLFFGRAWRGLDDTSLGTVHPVRPEPRPDTPLSSAERWRLASVFMLVGCSLWFYIALQQAGSTLMLLARDHTDRWLTLPRTAGLVVWEIPVGWLASIHAGLVIPLSPMVTALWKWYSRSGRVLSPRAQMAIGMALLAVAFGSLLPPLWLGASERIGFGWLLVCYTALSLSEICIGPLAYSLAGHVAHARYVGLLLGFSLLLTAIGSFLGGELGARLWTRWPPRDFFAALAVASLGACFVLIWPVTPLLLGKDHMAPGPGPGRGNEGSSLDRAGNVVRDDSADAHWPVKQ